MNKQIKDYRWRYLYIGILVFLVLELIAFYLITQYYGT